MSDIEEVRAALEVAANELSRGKLTRVELAISQALAALSRIEAGGAEGWQLVPVEPTEAMLGSFTGFVKTRLSKATATWVYQAMLARAPHPPGQPEKE